MVNTEKLEDFKYIAVNVPVISERGDRIWGIPTVFQLFRCNDTETYEIKSWSRSKFNQRNNFESLKPKPPNPLCLTREEILFALKHQQFARIGTTDQLAQIIKAPKRKSRSK